MKFVKLKKSKEKKSGRWEKKKKNTPCFLLSYYQLSKFTKEQLSMTVTIELFLSEEFIMSVLDNTFA